MHIFTTIKKKIESVTRHASCHHSLAVSLTCSRNHDPRVTLSLTIKTDVGCDHTRSPPYEKPQQYYGDPDVTLLL